MMGYFVRINDASAIRRRVLESSKELIHVLKGYQRILDIRDEKKELNMRLQELLSSLIAELGRLEKLMPERSLKEIEQYLPKRKAAKKAPAKKAKKGAKKAPAAPKEEKPAEQPVNEMERLEKALGNIEQRLNRL